MVERDWQADWEWIHETHAYGPSALQRLIDIGVYWLQRAKKLEERNIQLRQQTTYICIDEDYDGWECSVCGGVWSLIDGTPSENKMCFCPFCGAQIVKELKEELGEEMLKNND